MRSVVNELTVGPSSTFQERSNDLFVSGKVKASLLDAKDIFANSFKVVTERGVVYLMGIATRRETERATDIARGVSGVQKVVRVVEVVSESELANQAQRGGTGRLHQWLGLDLGLGPRRLRLHRACRCRRWNRCRRPSRAVQ